WPVADQHLGSGKVECEERFDVLLDRDAPHVEPDRLWKWKRSIRDWPEQFDIHPARPVAHVAKTMLFQLAPESWCCHHHCGCGSVEPAQPAIHDLFRHKTESRVHIFGKSRVKGRREIELASNAYL